MNHIERAFSVDDLLQRVRDRIGADGRVTVTMTATGCHPAQWRVEWTRDYGDCASDQRCADASTLDGALRAVLAWEDRADEADGLTATTAAPTCTP